MRIGRLLTALLSWLCLLLSCPAIVHAETFPTLEGLVVGVSEGDRIVVNSSGNEIRVKLYGIVPPQGPKIDKVTGLYKQGQPYAEESFRSLSSKVLHQVVKVEIRRMLVFKEEPRHLAVAVVYLDGRNVNMEMLAEGWGWVDRKFMSRIDYIHYSAAERVARSRREGLWLQDRPQPPWEFKPESKLRAKHD